MFKQSSRAIRWAPRALAILAVLVVGASLYYSHLLVQRIAEEERQQVRIWAEAVRQKAQLVRATNGLFQRLQNEERKKVELYAEAIRRLSLSTNSAELDMALRVIEDNETVPILLVDGKGNILANRNLDERVANDTLRLRNELRLMESAYDPIPIKLPRGSQYVYYRDSKLFRELRMRFEDLVESFIAEVVRNSASAPVVYVDSTSGRIMAYGQIDSREVADSTSQANLLRSMTSATSPMRLELGGARVGYLYHQPSVILKRLQYYPYFQLAVLAVFTIAAYWLLRRAWRAEQDRLWVGMAKETAHQLGTPISSLLAWLSLLREQYPDEPLFSELGADIERLETITERFSKIGSSSDRKPLDLIFFTHEAMGYLGPRMSRRVELRLVNETGEETLTVLGIEPLLSWVLENLVKNAVDAMAGHGRITLRLQVKGRWAMLDITDTGHGMTRSQYRKVFQPGYTSKERGWGLGLSLVQRIVEQVHKGRIFVLKSEVGKGTTFRLQLPLGPSA